MSEPHTLASAILITSAPGLGSGTGYSRISKVLPFPSHAANLPVCAISVTPSAFEVGVAGRAARLPAVLAGDVLVEVRAPPRARGHDDLTVLDRRRMIDQLVFPRHVVDVDLHDPHVRHARAEMGRVQRGEMAVVVVGRD